MASLKIVKIGVLNRKEDFVDGKKLASKKWKSWSVILTGSQLLFFVRRSISACSYLLTPREQKDPTWVSSLSQSIAKSARQSTDQDERQVITVPLSFKPDAVLSLANCAAIYDSVG